MYIYQKQLENTIKYFSPNKVLVIYGPRRTGKTTLLKHLVRRINKKYIFVSGEDIGIQEQLSSQSIEKLKAFIADNEFLIIDEAQKINNIGLNLKLIVDHIPNIKIIATGSSSFDLAKHIGEPLTGRKHTLKIFPLSQMELNTIETKHVTDSKLEERLIFGSYPEVIISKNNEQKISYLKEIVNSYLYKDILELDGIRNSDKILRLLQLLVFQIGKKISFNELGTHLGMSKNTIDRYLDLLEKTFVIFKLRGFSRNLRKEITKNHKYYFYDIGIRNALINNFNPLSMRDDIGMLWENYIIAERIKKQEYVNIYSNNYFWQTYDQKEIDFIEEREGKLFAFEIKWKESKVKIPIDWQNNYKNSEFSVITNENYLDFIS
ncbi:ATP-binding protein [bacterium]